MDRELLRQKTEEHRDVTLRIDSFLLTRLGIVKNAVHLKIAGYYLNCVPFDLSLTHCNAISILGPKEIETFSAYTGTIHNLNLTMDHPGYTKPISLYIKVRLKSFVQHNPDTKVCIISMDNITVPNDFAEIFVGVADELAFCHALYNDDQKATESVGMEAFRRQVGSPYFTLRTDMGAPLKGKALELTARTIKLYCDVEAGAPSQESPVEIEHPDTGAYAAGTISGVSPSTEADAYASITLDVRYSPAYITLLRRSGAEAPGQFSSTVKPANT
jgi:hypothetical protein